MRDYMEQLERVRRFLQRVEVLVGRNSETYQDDLWSFFQNAWHLKDWIKNDSSIPQAVRDQVVSDAEAERSLQICADLCNRSKHLQLNRSRHDADVNPGHNITVFPSSAGRSDSRDSQYTHNIVLPDATRKIPQDLCRQIVDDWTRILSANGLAV